MAGITDLIKRFAPAALGAFAPGIAGAIPGLSGLSPALQSAAISGIGGLIAGQKPKDALINALLGGGLGALFSQQAAVPEQMFGPDTAPMELLQKSKETGLSPSELAKQTPPGGAGFGAFKGVAPIAEAETMSGELLKSLGYAGSGKGNLLFRLMNTKMGEGLAAGLLAQLLADDDEDEGPAKGSYEQRPFGAGGPGGQIGGIDYRNRGGAMYFPRRNGGIAPSEGSGTKDDVPAMLTAGEFVMTRDAVKGAGNGDLNKGINNMYSIMNKFERMA